MTPDQIASIFRDLTPEQLTATFEKLHRVFSTKAERIYDQDPENNGLTAQPYADIAQMMEVASMVWEEEEEDPLDTADVTASVVKRPKLSERVSARKNPWGGR